MKNTLSTILLLALIFSASSASADVDNVGVFDSVLDRYNTAARSWAAVITNAASRLFWSLVTISMIWTFGILAMRRADIGEFFSEFLRFIIFTGFFWWLLVNGPAMADSIIRSMQQLGGNATGLDSRLYPSGIVDIGFEIYYRVLDQTSVWKPVYSAIGIIIAIAILIILTLVGINMLLLLASGWILAYGGIFFLGFGGARWTSDIAINYFKTVLGIAAQLFAMVLLIGIGKTFLDDYYTQMTRGISLKEMGVMLIVAVILLLLTNKIPQLISGIITGASIGGSGIGNFSAGAIVGASMGATGAARAAAATGGAAMAAGLANAAGGAQAIMAAVSKGSNIPTGNTGVSGSSSSIDSSMSGGGSGTSTPFAETAGFGSSGNSGSSGNTSSGGAKGFVGNAIKSKVAGIKSSAQGRIDSSAGGKLATAIKASKAQQANPLINSKSTQLNIPEEIKAFVDKG